MIKHISQKFKIFKKYLLNTDIYLIAMTRGNLQPKKKKKKTFADFHRIWITVYKPLALFNKNVGRFQLHLTC